MSLVLPGWTLRNSIAEWISNDACRVKVREHLWAQSVDDVRNLNRQHSPSFPQPHHHVAMRRAETDDQWAKGFCNVHADFSESKSCVCDGWEEDVPKHDNGPKWNTVRDPATNTIAI